MRNCSFFDECGNVENLYILRPNERIVTVEQLFRWQGLIHPHAAPLPPAEISEITTIIKGAGDEH